jgi:hypothetical protein
MDWKLCRGQFRPGLQGQIASNSEKTVVQVTTDSFALALDSKCDVRKTLDACAAGLKGCGPATASALLGLVAPQHFPFMADEAMLALGSDLGKGPLKYTAPQYCKFAELLRAKANALNAETSSASASSSAAAASDRQFTAHDLSQALWVATLLTSPSSKRRAVTTKPPPSLSTVASASASPASDADKKSGDDSHESAESAQKQVKRGTKRAAAAKPKPAARGRNKKAKDDVARDDASDQDEDDEPPTKKQRSKK